VNICLKVNTKEINLTFKPHEKKSKTYAKTTNTRKIGEKKLSIQEQILNDAMKSKTLDDFVNDYQSKTVHIHNIVRKSVEDNKEVPFSERSPLKANIQEM
jgi:hypothetical protein